jgi:hypothetical protein
MQAEPNEFSFMVSIMNIQSGGLNVTRDLICSGTLISYEDVLTSEHCFNVAETSVGFVIILGSINLLQGIKYYISWWITYDQWAIETKTFIKYVENDIAILRVSYSSKKILSLNKIKTIDQIFVYKCNMILLNR